MIATETAPKARLVSHIIRTKDGGRKTVRYGRRMAIALHCVECMGFESHPADCTVKLCPLYPFRARTLASQHGDPALV